MNISHYIELSIPPGFFQAGHKKPPIVKWFEMTIRLIHAVNARSGNHLPISLPDYKAGSFLMLGKRIRIFGEEKHLEVFVEEINKHENYTKNIDVTRIKRTPNTEVWHVFTSCIFPKRNKNTHENYRRKVEEFESIPQVKLQSQSNKNWYVLGIKVREAKSVEVGKNGGRVNSYGFSIKNDVVALPDF